MTRPRFTRATLARGRGRLGLLALAAAGLVALVVLAVACSPRSSRPPQAETPAPTASTATVGVMEPDPEVDLGDAEQVCAAFATALFTIAAGDGSPTEVYRRAAAYATGELAAGLVADQGRLPVPQQRPTPDGVDVTGYVGDHMRPDTDGVVYRTVLVTVTGHDGTAARHVVYCTLQQEDATWLVAGYEQERTLP